MPYLVIPERGLAKLRRNRPSARWRGMASAPGVVPNVNWFMGVPISQDGHAEIVEGRSRPDEDVGLRAKIDVIAVLSNCPQEFNPRPPAGWYGRGVIDPDR